jgi:hypothetical protein
VVLVSVLVRPADGRAPLRIAAVWTQVSDHDDDALPLRLASATGAAGRGASGGQVVAFSASTAAPAGAGGVEEGLGACCSVDPGRDAELELFVSSVGLDGISSN